MTPCIISHLKPATRGYPRRRVNGIEMNAHRAEWVEAFGPVSEGYDIDHLCRNRRCINLDHLESVTHAENVRRQWRDTPLCRRGLHPRISENRIVRVWNGRELTLCEPCHRANEARKALTKRHRRHRAALDAELAS